MKSFNLSLIPFINFLRNYGLEISTAEVILAQKIFDSDFSSKRTRFKAALKSILIRDFSDVENFEKCFEIYFLNDENPQTLDFDTLGDENDNEISHSSSSDILTYDDGVNGSILSNPNETIEGNSNDFTSKITGNTQKSGSQFNFRSEFIKEFSIEFIRWTPFEIRFVSESISFSNMIRRKLANERFINLLKLISLEKSEDISKILFKYSQTLNIALKQTNSTLTEVYPSKSQEILYISNIFEKKILEFLRETRLFLVQNNLVTLEDFNDILILNQQELNEHDLLTSDFSKINKNVEEIKNQLIKLGKKLAIKEKRKQKFESRGKIDFRKTFRANLTHGGALLEVKFRHKIPDKPEIFLLLDVSMSMSWTAEFFFLISYAGQLIWNLKLYEFNNTTVDVTQVLRSVTLDEAYIKRKSSWKKTIRPRIGHSNYETSLEDFYELISRKLTKKSRIIILGDCRDYLGYWRSSGWENSRFGQPESMDWVKKFVDKSKEVIILNPEPKSLWNTGDSVCQYYSKVGAKIHHVNNLESLIKFIFKH